MIIIKKLKNDNLLENDKRTEQLLNNPKFINWFKGSKVVDENGNPLVCYHGTTSVFSNFRTLSHFGTKKASNEFVVIPGNNNNIIPVYLSIKNPLKIEDESNNTPMFPYDLWKQDVISYDQMISVYGITVDKKIKNLIKHLDVTIEDIKHIRNYDIINNFISENQKFNRSKLISIIQQKGYDGFYYINKEEDRGSISWIILNSNQVWPIFKNSSDRKSKGINLEKIEELNLSNYRDIKKGNWDLPEDLIDYLEKNNCKLLGKGEMSYVFEGDNFVIKVYFNTDYDSSTEKKWYDYCYNNYRKNKHLPKVGKLREIEDWYIVFIEKLEPVKDARKYGSLDEAALMDLAYSLNEFSDEADAHMWWNNEFGYDTKTRDFYQVCDLAKTLLLIEKNVSENLDLHSENIMMRGDTLVISDPIADTTINPKYQ